MSAHYHEKHTIKINLGEEITTKLLKQTFKEDKSFYLSDTSLTKQQFYDVNTDEIFQEVKQLIQSPNWWKEEKYLEFSRACASFLGAFYADAIGANTQFKTFKPERSIFNSISWNQNPEYTKQLQGRPVGLSTDDTSMARCIADSLIVNDFEMKPIDHRGRYLLWWNLGYNNGSDDHRSFGLGGNISESFSQFTNKDYEVEYTVGNVRDRSCWGYNCGNGSIMRLSPVPIAFHDDEKQAMDMAMLSSLTTHNGEEAAECCRLLAFICVRAFHRKQADFQDIQDFLDQTCGEFETTCQSVKCLARSQKEPPEVIQQYINAHQNLQHFNKNEEDRNWNWQKAEFVQSPTRRGNNPGYYGSYCMDGLHIALHIVYNSQDMQECLRKTVNYGGDCDSFGAVALQIAGAYYGMEEWMMQFYFEQWKETSRRNYTPISYYDNFNTFYLTYRLFYQFGVKKVPQKKQSHSIGKIDHETTSEQVQQSKEGSLFEHNDESEELLPEHQNKIDSEQEGKNIQQSKLTEVHKIEGVANEAETQDTNNALSDDQSKDSQMEVEDVINKEENQPADQRTKSKTQLDQQLTTYLQKQKKSE